MAQFGRTTGDHDLPWHDESADTAARGKTQIETAPPAPPIYDANDPTLRLGGGSAEAIFAALGHWADEPEPDRSSETESAGAESTGMCAT